MNVFALHSALISIALISVTAAHGQDSTQVAAGKEVYSQHCTLCHGVDGKRGEGFQTPIWGQGSLIASKFGNVQAMIDYMQITAERRDYGAGRGEPIHQLGLPGAPVLHCDGQVGGAGGSRIATESLISTFRTLIQFQNTLLRFVGNSSRYAEFMGRSAR